MSVPILSCPCGLRMKAKGATPGRVGRCPRCGEILTVPEVVGVEARTRPEAVQPGYGLNPTFRPPVAKRAKNRTFAGPSRLPEVSPEVEPWSRPAILFPLRGAEGLMIVAMLGLASWAVATLLPELCLQFVADSGRFGAALMGMLISVVVALPGVALGFLAVGYTFQYLGRVLVTGAMGEVVPPRPPDRNFDGLFNGLEPWLVWLVCGATIGLGPLAAYLLLRSGDAPASPILVLLLVVVGLPYALMALLMTFLRDDGFPNPFGVVGALIRFGVGFLVVCAVELGLGLVVVVAFAAVLWFRDDRFWLYLPLMLPCWMLMHWAAIVGMRALGVFYHHHASILQWHRKKPWWDVTGEG